MNNAQSTLICLVIGEFFWVF